MAGFNLQFHGQREELNQRLENHRGAQHGSDGMALPEPVETAINTLLDWVMRNANEEQHAAPTEPAEGSTEPAPPKPGTFGLNVYGAVSEQTGEKHCTIQIQCL